MARWCSYAIGLGLVGACGRVGFDARIGLDPTGDGGADGASTDGRIASGDASTVDTAAFGACGANIAQLVDVFDGTLSPYWAPTTAPDVTVGEGSGKLTVFLPATSDTTSHYGGYVSTCAYDFTGGRVAGVIDQIPADGPTDMSIALSDPGGDEVGMNIGGGLLASYQNQGTFVSLAMAPFDPVAHKHLQLRVTAGTLFFETSPDGTTWTTMFSTAPPFSLAQATVGLEAGTYNVIADPGNAVFGPVDVP